MLQARALLRLLQTLLVVVAVATGATGITTAVLRAGAPVVSADVAHDADDDDSTENEDKNRGNDDDEDHVARGQVLEINTLKDPPEMQLAGFDGVMVVKVLKTDEIKINGVHLGDHVTVRGEKVNEQLFEATEIEVDRRCCGPPDNTNDNK